MTNERKYPRTDRLSESLREVIASEVEKLTDPRIGFVTITGVEVTGDLRLATVYYTALGDDEQKATTLAGLLSAAVYLRRLVGEQIRMKFTPELRFREDPAIVLGQRVDEILRDLPPPRLTEFESEEDVTDGDVTDGDVTDEEQTEAP